MHKTIKIRRIDSRTIKTRRREAQLTDSFGEALYLGLAPRPGREQQKTVLRQSLYWLDRKINATQRPKQSVCSWLPIGRVMKENFMARALNKNKKPETNNKNRACNYFLGSFGSPCSFWQWACPRWVTRQPQAIERFRRHATVPTRHLPQALSQLPTPSPD
jgi:hypothetical protein